MSCDILLYVMQIWINVLSIIEHKPRWCNVKIEYCSLNKYIYAAQCESKNTSIREGSTSFAIQEKQSTCAQSGMNNAYGLWGIWVSRPAPLPAMAGECGRQRINFFHAAVTDSIKLRITSFKRLWLSAESSLTDRESNTTTSHASRGGPFWIPQAPPLTTISCVAQWTSASTGASDQFYFVWDSSNGKSTGSDLRLRPSSQPQTIHTTTSYKYWGGPFGACRQHHIGPPYRLYNALDIRLNRCWWPIILGWDGKKGKSTGPDLLLTDRRYYNLV